MYNNDSFATQLLQPTDAFFFSFKMSDDETKPLLGDQQNKKYKLKDEKRNIHKTPETTSIKYEKLRGEPSPSPLRSPTHAVKNRLPLYKPRSLFSYIRKVAK